MTMPIANIADNPKVLPMVRCRLSPDRVSLIIDRCPFCGEPHAHGAKGGLGHRSAHCAEKSSSNERGYVLVLDPV